MSSSHFNVMYGFDSPTGFKIIKRNILKYRENTGCE